MDGGTLITPITAVFDSMPVSNNFTQNNLRISNLNNVQLHN
jgi:hypothetical protein